MKTDYKKEKKRPEGNPIQTKEIPDTSLKIFTDGSARTNDVGRPGTWAFVIVDRDTLIHEESSKELSTTNNRMELTAVLETLLYINRDLSFFKAVTIHTDSSYVYNGCLVWMFGWKKNDFRRSGEDMPNADLWKRIYKAYDLVKDLVTFKQVKGHNGDKWNEYCDSLCKKAYGDTIVKDNNTNDMVIPASWQKEWFETKKEPTPAERILLTIFHTDLEQADWVLMRDYVENYLTNNKLI